MASTMVRNLLEQSRSLIEAHPRRASSRRRAVSTAYYAVFHALARCCANALVRDVPDADESYERVYRALDHGGLRNAFSQKPMRTVESFAALGAVVVELQKQRNMADYMPPDLHAFPLTAVRALVGQAESTLDRLDALSQSERLTLATCLLFKTRKD